MGIEETEYLDELSGVADDSGDRLLRLFGRAAIEAMIEDWTMASLELYRASEAAVATRQLPDDTIGRGSPLEDELMQALAGAGCPVGGLAASVRDFLSLVVSGTRVLEDETAFCRVVWVADGAAADPVFAPLERT